MKHAHLLVLLLLGLVGPEATAQDSSLVPIPVPCAATASPLPPAPPPLEIRAPRFLEPLWRAHITGAVQLRLTVHSSGSVSSLCLVRGINALADRFTAQAARMWRFPPADAAAREATVTFTYAFEEPPPTFGPGPNGTVFQPPFNVLLLASPLPPAPPISVSHGRPQRPNPGVQRTRFARR